MTFHFVYLNFMSTPTGEQDLTCNSPQGVAVVATVACLVASSIEAQQIIDWCWI